jgi:hypothetical protein
MTTEKEKKNKTRSEGGRGQRSVAFRVKATARGVTFSRFVFFFVVFAKLSAVSSRTNVWSVFDGESDGVVALGATAAATRSLFPGGGGEKGEDGEDGEDDDVVVVGGNEPRGEDEEDGEEEEKDEEEEERRRRRRRKLLTSKFARIESGLTSKAKNQQHADSLRSNAANVGHEGYSYAQKKAGLESRATVAKSLKDARGAANAKRKNEAIREGQNAVGLAMAAAKEKKRGVLSNMEDFKKMKQKEREEKSQRVEERVGAMRSKLEGRAKEVLRQRKIKENVIETLHKKRVVGKWAKAADKAMAEEKEAKRKEEELKKEQEEKRKEKANAVQKFKNEKVKKEVKKEVKEIEPEEGGDPQVEPGGGCCS